MIIVEWSLESFLFYISSLKVNARLLIIANCDDGVYTLKLNFLRFSRSVIWDHPLPIEQFLKIVPWYTDYTNACDWFENVQKYLENCGLFLSTAYTRMSFNYILSQTPKKRFVKSESLKCTAVYTAIFRFRFPLELNMLSEYVIMLSRLEDGILDWGAIWNIDIFQ